MPVPARSTLALDTSGPVTCVALSRADGRLFELESPETASHDEDLAAMVAGVMGEARVEPRDISRLVVGAGPGSFTGLRIGFGFMKGFALALGAGLSAISSLEAMAAGAEAEGLIVPMSDARSGRAFAALYGKDASGLRTAVEPGLFTAEELRERIVAAGGDAAIVTWHDDLFVSELEFRRLRPRKIASSILSLASQARGGGSGPAALSALQPQYVRAVAAKKISERMAKR